MTRTFLVRLIFLAIAASGLSATTAADSREAMHAVFGNARGDLIELNSGLGLRDCSDEFQYCFTAPNGIAFSYYRKCNQLDAGVSEPKFKFRPGIVSIDHHEGEVWLLFVDAPNYLFHYSDRRGIIGINRGPTPAYDFRKLLREGVTERVLMEEFRILDGHALAMCE